MFADVETTCCARRTLTTIDEVPGMADETALLDWLGTMREKQPVWQDRYGVWHVFRHADVQTVLRDTATFSSDPTRVIEGASPTPGAIHEIDPPEHRALRKVVSSAFTPRTISDLEPRIRDVTRSLLADAGESFDLVDVLAFPLPVTIVAELLGLPPMDHEQFGDWSGALVDIQMDDPTDPALAERIADVLNPLTAYLKARCAERRADPGDDLISRLVLAEVDGRALDDEEAANFSTALLLAGHITTTVLLGNIVRTLDEHPAHWDAAAEDPGRIPAIVEEVLRYRPPFPQMQRTTTKATEVAGVPIPADVMVNTWVLSANRDSDAHDDPDRFDPSRKSGGAAQLSFGHGVHFCLGAPLARLENRVALEEIIARFGRLTVDRDDERLRHFEQIVLGTRHLPVLAGSSPRQSA
uniref:ERYTHROMYCIN C-12 HYDROXYLASE n=1 Tax=Saccharopolyspora erythraea (strain ATCC 11635 / DSM 40517 / JCM 4748 / NBRC 13426 / NCIMB 8594 / NRRL 2338) TaxID=405948 RepID=UPI00032822C9|nr:Chain A, ERYTHROMYCIN C-12 HYDROXYLASE [Saccharopolyspora erythraea NRRL 2338]